MSFETETGRRSGRSIAAPLFTLWTAVWMIEGARLVPETRGIACLFAGAGMGFVVAQFLLLLILLARMGRTAFAVRIVTLGTAGALLAAAVWLAFPGSRTLWVPLW